MASTDEMSQRAKNVAHGLRGMAEVKEYGTTDQGVAERRSEEVRRSSGNDTGPVAPPALCPGCSRGIPKLIDLADVLAA